MASRPKVKMPVSERAKQFSPFSALKGLEEALAAREKVPQPRRILAPEEAEVLNRALVSLRPGDIATVVFYRGREYCQLTGQVTKIDPENCLLMLEEEPVYFEDLYRIIPPEEPLDRG